MTEAVVPRQNRLLLAQWADLLENDAYRRFWLMRIASNGAINALSYALLVFTVRQSSSALATGVLLLTALIPSAILGAFAGVVVDKLPRGAILFASQLLRAMLAFLLIGAKDDLAALYAVSLGLGFVAQFAVPAESAVLPHIVRADRLTAANSFITLGTLGSQVLGMLILAPLLLKTTDGGPLLFIVMGAFAFAAVLVTVIPQFHFVGGGDGRPVTFQSARREFAEGWLTLNRDAIAYLALILSVVASISTLVIATMLPKFSTEILGIPPENIVFVLAPVIVGVFCGLRSVEWLANRFNKLVTISSAYVLMAAALIALGLVRPTGSMFENWNLFGLYDPGPLNGQSARVAATILYGNAYVFAFTIVVTMARVLLNERVPMRMQGRVFAAQAVLSNLAAIVPVGIAALLADVVGVAPVLVTGGIVALLAAVWSRAKASRAVPAVSPPPSTRPDSTPLV